MEFAETVCPGQIDDSCRAVRAQEFFSWIGGIAGVQTVFLIGLFGALGCVARYYLSGWVHGLTGPSFPFGTLAVNAAGSFLVGLVMETGTRTTLLSPDLRIALVIGLLGGLTTFSTFSYETFRQIEGGQLLPAALNIGASLLACLFFTGLGIISARHL